MQGEVARGWNPEPQRAPVAPVLTRRVHSDAPDPGAASGPLPPFRPGSAGSPLDDVHAVPAAGISLDTEPPAQPDRSAHDLEAARAEPVAHLTESEPEDVLLLDEVVDADVAEAELDAFEPWRAPEAAASVETAEDLDLDVDIAPASEHTLGYGDEVEAADAGAALEAEPDVTQASDEEEPWDPLGEALQEAVARANPPLAEDRVRSAEPGDHGMIEELQRVKPAPRAVLERLEAGEVEAGSAAVDDRSSVATHTADVLSEDLAATLESLAGKLRARGFSGLDDAFTRGGRLESSLALFLAGYRAGLDE